MSQEVNSRKHVQLMTSQVAKKDTQVKHETFYSHKFSKRLADQNRREHEDHLKHFQVSASPTRTDASMRTTSNTSRSAPVSTGHPAADDTTRQ